MPAPLNLVGRRLGALTVLSRTEGRARGGIWQCQCDCGAIENIPAWKLPYAPYVDRLRRDVRRACYTCQFTRSCAVCNTLFIAPNNQACCSASCLAEHKRAKWRTHYYRLISKDPDYTTRVNAQKRMRAATDPKFAQRLVEDNRKQWKQKQSKLRLDPVLRAKTNARQRARYARNAATVLARRHAREREFLASLSPEQLTAWRVRRQEYSEQYYQKFKAELKKDPKLYREYLDRNNEYLRKHKRDVELKKLARVATELETRGKKWK